MAKIMLVEDDNSLREIYEARLAAEGYTVVSAKDGEEALAMALKERPDLIIADVMMPKVSGFDMLDILRSTPETKNTKIIMMTALSQAEDKARAEKLGADRYLVKSQVTLEDVTREAHAILDSLEKEAADTVAKVEGTPAQAPVSAPTPAPEPPKPTEPAKPAEPQPAPTPAPTPAPEPTPPPTPTVTSIPVAAPDDDNDDDDDAQDTPEDKKLDEAAKALSQPEKEEKAEVTEQVDEFIASNPTLSSSPEPEAKADPAKAVADAVDSLTQPSAATDKPKEEKSGRSLAMPEGDAKPESDSLQHTKTITPTPEAARGENKPDLNALLAKEGETIDGAPTPATDTVISPNDTGGSPPTN